MDIKKASKEELQAELSRREEEDRNLEPPKPVAHPDWSMLRKTIDDGIALARAEGYFRDDFRQYVYEAAITAHFGGNAFWTWRRTAKLD